MTSAFFLQPLGTSMAAQNYRPSSTEKRCSSHQVNAVTSERSAQPVQHEGSKQQSFIPYQEFEKLSKAAQGITTIQQGGGVYVDGGGVLRIKALSDTAASRPQASNGQGYTSQLKTDKGTYTTTVVPSGNGDLDFYLTNDRISGTLAAVTIPYDLQQLMQAQFGMPMITIESEQSTQALGLMFTLWYSSMIKTVDSLTRSGKRTTSPGIALNSTKSKGNTLQDHQREFCVNHDFDCTGVPDFFDIPWIDGMRRVDFTKCCEEHDITLWCGPPLVITPILYEEWWTQARLYSAYASTKLAACILWKFIDASLDIPWYYNWGYGTAFFYYLGLTVSAAYAGGTNVFDLYTQWTQYYPQDGRNKESCLCGGDKPTTQCDNRCRDLCKERGISSRCITCGWECVYNDAGLPIDVTPIRPLGDQVCCPGTDVRDDGFRRRCGLQRREDAFAACRPRPCDRCFYRCEYTKVDGKPGMTLGWVYHGTQKLTKRGCCQPHPTIPKNIPCDREGKTVS
ncbi:MAG: hypothetical protein JNL32_14695 [Candidatus Kapabacteria bacterium]|nr:hypothetical protein [Candidatus Kapabacteria bacterium]